MGAVRKHTRPRSDCRYTKALGERIAAQVANGSTFTEIAQDLRLSPRTISSWRVRYKEFDARCGEAESLALARDEDRLVILCREVQSAAAADGSAKAINDAAKLEIETIKWRLTKRLPHKYGEKSQLELTGKDGENLLPKHTREEDAAFAALIAAAQAKTPPPTPSHQDD